MWERPPLLHFRHKTHRSGTEEREKKIKASISKHSHHAFEVVADGRIIFYPRRIILSETLNVNCNRLRRENTENGRFRTRKASPARKVRRKTGEWPMNIIPSEGEYNPITYFKDPQRKDNFSFYKNVHSFSSQSFQTEFVNRCKKKVINRLSPLGWSSLQLPFHRKKNFDLLQHVFEVKFFVFLGNNQASILSREGRKISTHSFFSPCFTSIIPKMRPISFYENGAEIRAKRPRSWTRIHLSNIFFWPERSSLSRLFPSLVNCFR